MEEKQWIGFDLDHTLIRYNLLPLMRMIDSGYRTFLSREIPCLKEDSMFFFDGISFEQVPVDPGYYRRGTVLDYITGDLLFLGINGLIFTAFHGRKRLVDGEIKQKYPGGIWGGLSLLNEDVQTKDFFIFSEFFTLGVLFGSLLLVEVVDASINDDLNNYSCICLRNIEFFRHSFHWENFSRSSGSFFPRIRENVSKYVSLENGFVSLIETLRRRGFKVFLCSNSHIDYIHFLMSHLTYDSCKTSLDPTECSWTSSFDRIYAFAQKPHFFSQSTNPTFLCDLKSLGTDGQPDLPGVLRVSSSEIDYNGRFVFIGGNADHLPYVSHIPPIYVGDHLVSDFAASESIGWTGIAVIEDDDAINSNLGFHFPKIFETESYWQHRISRTARHILNDVFGLLKIEKF